AGISKPPATYAQLAQLAKQVKEKTGKYAFFITFVPEDSAEVLESLVQMGVKLVDAQGKAAFNSPEGKAAFQYWVDLYKQGLLPKEVLTEGHRKGIELYQAGETAVLVTGAQFLNSIAKNAPEIAKVSATAPQITGKTGKKSVAVMNLVIPRNTDQADGIEFPLSLLGDFQFSNSALAIAALQFLQQQGWEISLDAIVSGMGNAKWPGRVQWVYWQNHRILIDGANNPAAAIALRQYINSLNPSSVNWVMGMLSTKDHADVFQALLQPNDQLHLVPVPDHSFANPEDLATLAQQVCPQLSLIQTYPNLISALEATIASNQGLTVLCGSLYLLGYFFQLVQKSL
ncbi:MAG TPA: extracellular solute-binding protein, partial [Phormidium sp.]